MTEPTAPDDIDPVDRVLALANDIAEECGGACLRFDLEAVEIVFEGGLAFARQQHLPPNDIARAFLACFLGWLAEDRKEVRRVLRHMERVGHDDP